MNRPSHVYGELSVREARFVELYLRETSGNGRLATRLAGYRGSTEVLDVQAARLLKRERVRLAIQYALQAESERSGLTKEDLVRKVYNVFVQGTTSERLRAAGLLAKLLGWFVPMRQVPEAPRPPLEAASYAALVETLRSIGHQLAPQHREAMRHELSRVISEATKALELLGRQESQ